MTTKPDFTTALKSIDKLIWAHIRKAQRKSFWLDQGLAEDLYQEITIHLYTHYSLYNPQFALTTWATYQCQRVIGVFIRHHTAQCRSRFLEVSYEELEVAV